MPTPNDKQRPIEVFAISQDGGTGQPRGVRLVIKVGVIPHGDGPDADRESIAGFTRPTSRISAWGWRTCSSTSARCGSHTVWTAARRTW